MKDVVILGSTGSIGTQALDLVRANPDRFRVVGLTAGGGNPDLFARQVAEFAPRFSGLGEEASTEAAAQGCDVVLNGITFSRLDYDRAVVRGKPAHVVVLAADSAPKGKGFLVFIGYAQNENSVVEAELREAIGSLSPY